jgi:hypothetical protein
MIPVGAQVRMSDKGRKIFGDCVDNPHDLVGTVVDNERKFSIGLSMFDCEVKWSNGFRNTYNYRHLTPLINLDNKKLEDYM